MLPICCFNVILNCIPYLYCLLDHFYINYKNLLFYEANYINHIFVCVCVSVREREREAEVTRKRGSY